MAIKTGYFGFEVSDLDAWEKFGDLLGLGIERSQAGLFFRIDEKVRRIHCVQGLSDDIAWVGWEVDSLQEYDQRRDHLRGMGIDTKEGDAASAELRGVEQFFHFHDSNGVRFEIAYGLKEAAPFVSDKIMSGFITGELGIGHVALNTSDHLRSEKFMREALFAHLSDYIYQPMPSGEMARVAFLHTNPRHHSIAFAEGPLGGSGKLHHFQLEMASMMDLGKTYERLQAAGIAIRVTLGQHSNDHKMTFYAQTPSHFLIEIGYGGLTINDEESWKPVVHNRISEWGHKFQLA